MFAASILAVSMLAGGGCAARELGGDEALARGPLPYAVGLFVDEESFPDSARAPEGNEADDEEGAPLAEQDAPESGDAAADGPAADEPETDEPETYDRPRYLAAAETLLERMAQAIATEFPVVSHVRPLAARNLVDALEEASGLDLLLAVGLETPSEFSKEGLSAPWMTLEVASWLFGGIPSWFVPSTRYTIDTRLEFHCLDLHQRRAREALRQPPHRAPEFDWGGRVDVHRHNISLFDRSGFLERPQDYALTLFVPPGVLPAAADSTRLSRSLTDAVHDECGEHFAALLRQRLLEEDWRKPLRVAFLSPAGGGRQRSLDLVLAVASFDGIPVDALDIERSVLEADAQVPEPGTFRWEADATDLASISTALASVEHPGDFVRFQVPRRIPLASGTNLVRVHVRRQDGDEVVRTMRYSR